MTRFAFELDMKPDLNGWRNDTIYSFKGPKIDEHKHFVEIMFDTGILQQNSMSLEKYAEFRKSLLTGNLDVTVSKSENVSFGTDLRAHELVLKRQIEESIIYLEQYFFILDGDRAITATCRYTKKSHKELGAQVRRLLEALFMKATN